MCGIVGIYEYGLGRGSVDRSLLVRMRDTLVHRGPDGEGLYISNDERVGLGHRRLSIIDLAHGAQPMSGLSGEMIVFNGEIYNYPELRRDLEARGVPFRTTCDTEVILRLYELYGEKCVDHLNGMFAFAIWDPQRERLFFARDRVGEKPLYWADFGGRFLFASEIKALLQHPSLTSEVNAAALPAYLTNLVTSAPETLYRGINKLPPGFKGVCAEGGVRVEQYWNPFEPRAFLNVSRGDAAVRVREMLDASVHARLMSDVPVGVLLSGGVDSTALVALLREQATGLATFSVGFDDNSALDERAEARRAAAEFGTDHHEVVVSQREGIDFLADLVHHQDEPLGDPVCIPLHFVCRLARQNGVKVVLAGEGSDELFWGYPRYKLIARRWRSINALLALPGPVRRLLPAVAGDKKPQVRELLEQISSGRPLPMHMPLGLPRRHRERVLASRVGDASPGWAPLGDGRGESRFERLGFDTQEYEFGLRLPELLLMRLDRFSMANSVEARVPFLDPDIVDYVYRLPFDYKLHEGRSKALLKDALGDTLPEWVVKRRKQGFTAPVDTWLRTQLGDIFAVLLREPALARYFDVQAVAQALHANREDAKPAMSLWPIVNFALWHRHWIEDKPFDDLEERLKAA